MRGIKYVQSVLDPMATIVSPNLSSADTSQMTSEEGVDQTEQDSSRANDGTDSQRRRPAFPAKRGRKESTENGSTSPTYEGRVPESTGCSVNALDSKLITTNGNVDLTQGANEA